MKKAFRRGILLAILTIFALSLPSCKRLHEHDFGDWVYTKEPTCTLTGEKYRTCECGERESVAVASLGVHELENNICVMCKRNLNPYFFNLFKSLISEEYPLVIKELSFLSSDKSRYYSFKNTELVVSTVSEEFSAQLIGECEITDANSPTVSYDFVATLDEELMHARLISATDEASTPHYISLPLTAVKINSELPALEEELRENALLKHSSTLSLLVNSIKEWRTTVVPAIISFAESHFDSITPFLNDYFTSLFKVSLVDNRVGLELDFSKIREFNNSLYNEKVSALYEEITKEPYDKIEGKITRIMNTTVGELLSQAEEGNLDITKTVQYCFTTLYNLRVISSSQIPESISEKLNDARYTDSTLLSIIAEQLNENEKSITESTKSAISKIGELTGYQYIFKLIEGKNYDAPTAEENASIRDRWNSVNSRLISFSSFADTTFVTDGIGRLYSFKMTFRAGGSTINIRLDKEYQKTAIPSETLNDIKTSTALPTRDDLKLLLANLSGASLQGNILSLISENVNDNLQNEHFIEEYDISECLIVYSPSESGVTVITLLGSKCPTDENGTKLNTDATYTTLTLIYDTQSNTLTYK